MGAITLRIAYGYHTVDGPDPYIKMFETVGHNFAAATRPAAFLVDIVPARKFQHQFCGCIRLLKVSPSAILARMVTWWRIPDHSKNLG